MWLRVEFLGAAVEEEPACRLEPWCIRGGSDEARDQRLDLRHLRWVEVVRVRGVDRAEVAVTMLTALLTVCLDDRLRGERDVAGLEESEREQEILGLEGDVPVSRVLISSGGRRRLVVTSVEPVGELDILRRE
jgi:hypothetical protein